MRRTILQLAVAGITLASTPSAHADEATIRAMAQGGHAIVIRHARVGSHDRALVLDPAGNCANEANLSDEVRAQARRRTSSSAAPPSTRTSPRSNSARRSRRRRARAR